MNHNSSFFPKNRLRARTPFNAIPIDSILLLPHFSRYKQLHHIQKKYLRTGLHTGDNDQRKVKRPEKNE